MQQLKNIQRMSNQISRRQRLLQQLQKLLSDQLIQNDIPEDLRQQATALLKYSSVSINDKENAVKFQKTDLQKTNKSVSLKKFGNKNQLTISINQSPKRRTQKKNHGQSRKMDRTNTDASYKQSKSPKYVRLSASNSSLQKYNYESIKIKEALSKVKDIQNQKAFLQQKVLELKHLILEQKNKLDNTKWASKNIDYNSASLQKSRVSTEHNIINRRRVCETVQQQQKVLSIQLKGTQKQNESVQTLIKEQEQLISMYKVVIEQLKKQVKNQSKIKANIQQELMTSKNVLEKAKQKYELLFKKTQNLINKLDKGLRGILG